MLLQALLFLAGAVALYYGAEWLVRGSSRMARSFGISATVVGLTVVAFGTSAPELVVSVLASWRGEGGVAVGNVVGSNVINLGLIVGMAAVVTTLRVQRSLVLREAPLMVAAALTLPLLALDGGLSRPDGVLLGVAFAAYLAVVVQAARRDPPAAAERSVAGPGGAARGTRLRSLGVAAAGLAVLAAGAQLLVGAAVFFARAAGISEVVVGLTVVAVGTSLPELATSVVAAARREAEIAVGNIVGSNIFNSLLILGAAALTRPVAVDRSLFSFEVPAMVGISLLFPLLAWTRRMGRLQGAVLLASYAGFTGVLLLRAGVVG